MPENLVSRDGFSHLVPYPLAHLHSQAEAGAYLRDSSRVPRRTAFWRCYTFACKYEVVAIWEVSDGSRPAKYQTLSSECPSYDTCVRSSELLLSSRLRAGLATI